MSEPHKTIVLTAEDIREALIERASDIDMSGYAIQQYMKKKGAANSSGARFYLLGRFKSITTTTLLNLCDALDLEVALTEKKPGKKIRKSKEREPWQWEQALPGYVRLLSGGEDDK